MRPARLMTQETDGTLHAAVDLGTNSFHLLIARVGEDGQFDVVAQEKEMVRLGSGAGDLAVLTDEAMDRGIACLTRFRQLAEAYEADFVAVATSAVREAKNQDVFLGRARAEAGVDVQVVSGVEEARLIHLGVLQSLPVFDKRMLVVDIGGGSTEFVAGKGPKVKVARSEKVGAIRLTDRFFPEGRVRRAKVKECRTYIKSFLHQTFAELADFDIQVAVGSSGTITTVARMVMAAREEAAPQTMKGASFTRDELEQVLTRLIDARTPAERLSLGGLDERRVDIIVGGALLLHEIMLGLDIHSITISDYALREGILLDQVPGKSAGDFHHLSDIRRESVLRMADVFHEDLKHIQQSTDLALQLFDGLAELHGLDLGDRDMLEAAGLLHNVGVFVSHSAHHKHSYYIIRNSDQLVGFTDHEIQLIALIARYHRKSEPKNSHTEYSSLSSDDQHMVALLAGMLRIGIALDRTREGHVNAVKVQLAGTKKDPQVHIQVGSDGDADISLEQYTALARVSLLQHALGMPVELVFACALPWEELDD